MTHNPHNQNCEQNKCGHYVNCNNYACNGEHPCTCSPVQEIMKDYGQTFADLKKHDQEPTDCLCGKTKPLSVKEPATHSPTACETVKEPTEGWEEEFDREFPELVSMTDGATYRNVADRNKVITFISSLLQAERERILREMPKEKENWCGCEGVDSGMCIGECSDSYNTALAEVRAIITKEKGV